MNTKNKKFERYLDALIPNDKAMKGTPNKSLIDQIRKEIRRREIDLLFACGLRIRGRDIQSHGFGEGLGGEMADGDGIGIGVVGESGREGGVMETARIGEGKRTRSAAKVHKGHCFSLFQYSFPLCF